MKFEGEKKGVSLVEIWSKYRESVHNYIYTDGWVNFLVIDWRLEKRRSRKWGLRRRIETNWERERASLIRVCSIFFYSDIFSFSPGFYESATLEDELTYDLKDQYTPLYCSKLQISEFCVFNTYTLNECRIVWERKIKEYTYQMLIYIILRKYINVSDIWQNY